MFHFLYALKQQNDQILLFWAILIQTKQESVSKPNFKQEANRP